VPNTYVHTNEGTHTSQACGVCANKVISINPKPSNSIKNVLCTFTYEHGLLIGGNDTFVRLPRRFDSYIRCSWTWRWRKAKRLKVSFLRTFFLKKIVFSGLCFISLFNRKQCTLSQLYISELLCFPFEPCSRAGFEPVTHKRLSHSAVDDTTRPCHKFFFQKLHKCGTYKQGILHKLTTYVHTYIYKIAQL
jgi:hypothetical protein